MVDCIVETSLSTVTFISLRQNAFRSATRYQPTFYNHLTMVPRTPLRAVSSNVGKKKELSPFLRGKIL
jgi:hypothetical protein